MNVKTINYTYIEQSLINIIDKMYKRFENSL